MARFERGEAVEVCCGWVCHGRVGLGGLGQLCLDEVRQGGLGWASQGAVRQGG